MYIRTKNRIYQAESTLRDNGFIKGYNVGEMAFIRKDQVLNQSENLEELCDEFVVHRKESDYNFVWNEERNIGFNHFCALPEKFDVFGAIWASKGLIYIAKMNDKGEWELI